MVTNLAAFATYFRQHQRRLTRMGMVEADASQVKIGRPPRWFETAPAENGRRAQQPSAEAWRLKTVVETEGERAAARSADCAVI